MITVAEVRTALRVVTTSLDDEITDVMAAAKLDMGRVGIDTSESTDDELTDMAIKLYCKWHFDFMGKAEQYERQYCALRDALSMSTGYKEVIADA